MCGHYKGIDERLREHFITKEISIGDYVLSGGELGALVLSDALYFLVSWVINEVASVRLFGLSFQFPITNAVRFIRP